VYLRLPRTLVLATLALVARNAWTGPVPKRSIAALMAGKPTMISGRVVIVIADGAPSTVDTGRLASYLETYFADLPHSIIQSAAAR
jgi:hypothetical protein